MKLQKTELTKKLNKIKSVVPKKNCLPVLQGVLLADGYLIADNMEMTVKAKLEGTEGESFIIPERSFELINNLPDGEVEITVSPDFELTIKADRIKNKYQTNKPTLFPTREIKENGNEMTIKSDTLMDAIKHVSYAVASQNVNPIMTAMCLQASDGYLNFVGLDGHILAWDKIEYDGTFELLIPKNTIEKLKALDLTGDVTIKHNETSAVFVTEEYEIYTRLINGKYFPYRNMFSDLPLHTAVSRSALLDAMTRVKICKEDKCPVRFVMEGSTLSLSIKDSFTEYNETVDLKEPLAQPLTIGFDALLVLETLKAFDCDNVGISFDSPKMPMILKAEDRDFKAIVLPVAIH